MDIFHLIHSHFIKSRHMFVPKGAPHNFLCKLHNMSPNCIIWPQTNLPPWFLLQSVYSLRPVTKDPGFYSLPALESWHS